MERCVDVLHRLGREALVELLAVERLHVGGAKDVSARTHTIGVRSIYKDFGCNSANEQQSTFCTTTDFNDSFNVTVVEIPD